MIDTRQYAKNIEFIYHEGGNGCLLDIEEYKKSKEQHTNSTQSRAGISFFFSNSDSLLASLSSSCYNLFFSPLCVHCMCGSRILFLSNGHFFLLIQLIFFSCTNTS